MSKLSKQENLVLITSKNIRIEFEINQEAIKTTNEGIVVGDLYGYISNVNDTIVKIFGSKDKSELVGKHVFELLVKEEKTRAVNNPLASIMYDHRRLSD
jgi:PAS domain S-box-containing protein